MVRYSLPVNALHDSYDGNALKELGGLDEDALLMSPAVIEPIQELKVKHLGNNKDGLSH